MSLAKRSSGAKIRPYSPGTEDHLVRKRSPVRIRAVGSKFYMPVVCWHTRPRVWVRSIKPLLRGILTPPWPRASEWYWPRIAT